MNISTVDVIDVFSCFLCNHVQKAKKFAQKQKKQHSNVFSTGLEAIYGLFRTLISSVSRPEPSWHCTYEWWYRSLIFYILRSVQFLAKDAAQLRYFYASSLFYFEMRRLFALNSALVISRWNAAVLDNRPYWYVPFRLKSTITRIIPGAATWYSFFQSSLILMLQLSIYLRLLSFM